MPWAEVSKAEMLDSMGDIASFQAFIKRHFSVEGREPSGESFLLVELDGNGDVITDWFEKSVEEAKNHSAALADAEDSGLRWQPVRRDAIPPRSSSTS